MRLAVRHDMAWLNGDRRAPAGPRFPGAKAIAMAGVERGRQDDHRAPLRPLSPPSMPPARAIRARRVFDVALHDDPMRLRSANGPGNMATPRHMAMNLIPNAGGKHSPRARRKAAAGGSGLPQTPIAGTARSASGVSPGEGGAAQRVHPRCRASCTDRTGQAPDPCRFRLPSGRPAVPGHRGAGGPEPSQAADGRGQACD